MMSYLLTEFQASSIALVKAKSIAVFLIYPQKHMLWHSLEVPHQGAFNEYAQHIFS